MKVFAAVLVALVGICNALPSQQVAEIENARNPRFIGDIIVSIVESLTQNIPDPWIEEGADINIGLPVPILLNVDAHVKAVQVSGVSNIIINRMDFGLLSNRLDMNIYLPRIAISIGDAGLDATILGSEFEFSANANLVILEPRIAGSIQFNVGIITGIFVREVNLAFTLGGLQFEGEVKAFGVDLSSDIRELVNNLIPQRLKELESEVNELVGIIALELINQIL